MKKDVFIYLTIILLVLTFLLLTIIKNKYIYVENKTLHTCQKCVIINDYYYCQIYGINGGVN